MEAVLVVALVLAGIGALNWGLVGLFKFDLVAAVTGSKFGGVNPISRIVYTLVAAAGVLAFVSIGYVID